MELQEILKFVFEAGASDLHIAVGKPPVFRVNGTLKSLKADVLDPDAAKALTYSMLTEAQIAKFEKEQELDFSYHVEGIGRFRVNVHMERGSVGAVLRAIATKIPSAEDLDLPEAVIGLCELHKGLVLVTGPTGSGKSSTLAAMIDRINSQRACHIVTFEDPIEFVHPHKKSVVRQREIGADSGSFAAALKHVLRQDPDVILVGEMRDLETIGAAVTLAETGHLVFATLHTQDAAQTVDRIIDVFPSYQQQQIRMQLSVCLQGVISQMLLPKIGGGRVAAREIMVVTPAIANLIREGKTPQLYSAIQTGGGLGMTLMDQSLAKLVLEQKVKPEDALAVAHHPAEVARAIHYSPPVGS